MSIPVLMPALSPTMTEGTLAKWHVSVGDVVKSGQILADIETDKATMEVEAVDEGTIGSLLIPAGSEGVAVNTPIAMLLEDGETAESLTIPAKGPSSEPVSAAPAAPAHVASSVAPSPAAASVASASGRVIASPLARRLAKEKGIDVNTLKGTGPRGRIIKNDVLNAKTTSAGADKKAPALSAAVAAFGLPPARQEKATTMRKVIAERLSESKQTVPHFYLTVDVALDAAMALRAQLNGRPNVAYKLTVNDFIIKAIAQALVAVPQANASWQDGMLHYYEWPDISVAVAIDGGLITPIVRRAHEKSLIAISSEIKDLAARAKAGKLLPEEFQGGTFSLSNLGMFGISHFAAIVNPPQGGILAVGAGERRFVPDEQDQPVVKTVMSCTLSVDHRVVDGAVGASFLQAFKANLEDPLCLLLS
ncbi:MAG: pyruvate dehydrogenase complex dihydrolipoamide acetyltransferase [Alphaproteobacteria bacterium]